MVDASIEKPVKTWTSSLQNGNSFAVRKNLITFHWWNYLHPEIMIIASHFGFSFVAVYRRQEYEGSGKKWKFTRIDNPSWFLISPSFDQAFLVVWFYKPFPCLNVMISLSLLQVSVGDFSGASDIDSSQWRRRCYSEQDGVTKICNLHATDAKTNKVFFSILQDMKNLFVIICSSDSISFSMLNIFLISDLICQRFTNSVCSVLCFLESRFASCEPNIRAKRWRKL